MHWKPWELLQSKAISECAFLCMPNLTTTEQIVNHVEQSKPGMPYMNLEGNSSTKHAAEAHNYATTGHPLKDYSITDGILVVDKPDNGNLLYGRLLTTFSNSTYFQLHLNQLTGRQVSEKGDRFLLP